MERFIIERNDTAFLIIDIQEKLAAIMKARESVVNNCLHLIDLAKKLEIPNPARWICLCWKWISPWLGGLLRPD